MKSQLSQKILVRLPALSNMSIPLAIVLLLVGTTHAMNSTCCAPNMSALGYNALTTEFFDYYYEGVTGNNLAEVRGEDRTLYFEAATGTHYTRTPQGCVYVVDPSSIVSVVLDICQFGSPWLACHNHIKIVL